MMMMAIVMTTLTSRTPGFPGESKGAFPVYLINNYLVKTEHAMELMTRKGSHVKSQFLWMLAGQSPGAIHRCRLYF